MGNIFNFLSPKSGEILVSEAVYNSIKNQEGIHTEFVKEETLKNVEKPVEIYKVSAEILEQEKISYSATSNSQLESTSTKPINKRMVGAVSFGALIVLVLAYFLYSQNREGLVEKAIDKSIAVLAFDDQSPNGDQEWLGDGVADEILNVLAQVKDLKVSGKTSSFSFKDKDVTIKEIGEVLDVKTILEGSVSKVGDRIRITAQLIDVESDKHIWSDRYDRNAADIFAIVDEVAQSIVGSLMSELSVEEVENIKMVYQPNAEAYEYFIKAEHKHINEFSSASFGNNDAFVQAKEMYLKALSIDPDYMDALAGLANLYDTRGNITNTRNTRDADWKKRDSILNIAYQIDPIAPYVLYLKGFVSRNFDSAFYFLKKAYDLDPHNKGSNLLVYKFRDIGLYDLCISLCHKFLAIDPLNISFQNILITSLWRSGQIDETREQVIKSLEFDENNYYANQYLFIITLFVDRDTVEAKRISKKLYQLRPDSFRRALILAVEGSKEEALEENSGLMVYLILDMRSQALSLMDQRINNLDNISRGLFEYLSFKGNPSFDNIREEPQFQKWLKEAKVVHEERVKKYYHLFDD